MFLTFQALIDCRKNVCDSLKLNPFEIELSMGMSDDFEHAVSIQFISIFTTKKQLIVIISTLQVLFLKHVHNFLIIAD